MKWLARLFYLLLTDCLSIYDGVFAFFVIKFSPCGLLPSSTLCFSFFLHGSYILQARRLEQIIRYYCECFQKSHAKSAWERCFFIFQEPGIGSSTIPLAGKYKLYAQMCASTCACMHTYTHVEYDTIPYNLKA